MCLSLSLSILFLVLTTDNIVFVIVVFEGVDSGALPDEFLWQLCELLHALRGDPGGILQIHVLFINHLSSISDLDRRVNTAWNIASHKE